MDSILKNPIAMTIIKVTLALYAASIAPRMPAWVTEWFGNTYIKMALIALMVYISGLDIQMAVMLAIVYVAVANVSSGRGAFESFANFEKNPLRNNLGLIEPNLAVYPGCQQIKLQTLVDKFEGGIEELQIEAEHSLRSLLYQMKTKESKEKLLYIAHAIGFPYSTTLSDETAPLIATLLVYRGFDLGQGCVSPR